jgi:hypothetical protein
VWPILLSYFSFTVPLKISAAIPDDVQYDKGLDIVLLTKLSLTCYTYIIFFQIVGRRCCLKHTSSEQSMAKETA